MPRKRRKPKKPDLGHVARLVRAARVKDDAESTRDFRRRLVADFCKLLVDQLPTEAKTDRAALDAETLPPRHRQTLERLLAGDSEKQIAARLGISPHTVHQYVKALHKRFGVSSRGELLAKWVRA
jgi:DNA-binding CsgD family transcriptional regulator